MRQSKSKVVKSLLALATGGSLVTGLVASSIVSANFQSNFVSQSGSSTVAKLSSELDLNKSGSSVKNEEQTIETFLTNTKGTLTFKVGQEAAFKKWVKDTKKGSVTLGQVGGVSVTNIGTVFRGVDALTSITLPETLTTIGANAFEGTKLTEITIPASVTSIGDNAFPDTVKTVNNNTTILFKVYVSSIASVYDNASVLDLSKLQNSKKAGFTQIADGAFASFKKITGVSIPNTITSIGNNAFPAITSLKEIIFSGNWSQKAGIVNESSFANLQKGVSPDFTFMFSDKASCDAVCAKLPKDLQGKCKVQEVVGDDISAYLTNAEGTLTFKVGQEAAFKKWVKDTKRGSVILGQVGGVNVTNIGTVFRGVDALISITLPGTLTTIGDNAFYGCTGLTTVNLDQLDKLTTIGANAFSGCTSLTSVVIPAEITNIGVSAFSECTSLKEVTFMGTKLINLGSNVFMKGKVEKFLFEDQTLLDALKNKSDAGIDPDKCSLITSGLSDGAIVGITLAAIFASVCLVVGIVVPIRKRKMNALNHQDGSQTESNE